MNEVPKLYTEEGEPILVPFTTGKIKITPVDDKPPSVHIDALDDPDQSIILHLHEIQGVINGLERAKEQLTELSMHRGMRKGDGPG